MYMFNTNHVGHTGHSTIIISSYMKLENYLDAIVGVLQVTKQFGKVNIILRSQLVKVNNFVDWDLAGNNKSYCCITVSVQVALCALVSGATASANCFNSYSHAPTGYLIASTSLYVPYMKPYSQASLKVIQGLIHWGRR